jgi:hypothetical protein
MTAKEKAKELVRLYYEVDGDSIYDGITRGMAKQCALICVDEIISIPSVQAAYAQGYSNSKSTESYWREVKQEIEKL